MEVKLRWDPRKRTMGSHSKSDPAAPLAAANLDGPRPVSA